MTTITYGRDDDSEETFASIVKETALIRLTDAEIDRIVAARDEYHRETKHRGYPVRG